MGSLRFSIPLDPFDSKRFHFSANSFQFPDPFPNCSVTTRTFTFASLTRVSKNRVSRLDTEANETRTCITENDSVTVETSWSSKLKGGNNITRGTKKDVARKFSFPRESNELELDDDLFVNNGEIDVNYSAIKPGLSLEHYNAILKRLECCSDNNAVKFFDWMRCKGKLEGNIGAYTLILRVLARREEWDRAEDLVKELCGFHKSFQVFNTVIYACSKKGNVKLGSKWFQLMLELGVRPNVATIGMLMGLYQKNWNVHEAEFAFSQMRKFGIVCESAYSAMVTIYTRLRLYGKAEEVIHLMKQDRVRLNLENWLVMLNAYSQQGKMEQAESVFISMEAAGFARNIIAYNTLITGYGKLSKMEAAQSLFHRFCDIGLEPDETSYRSMIEGWGRADNYQEAKRYYHELKRLGYKPNSSNLFTLINLQAKYGDKDGAIKTIEDMVNIGCQYSSILGIVLQAYEKVGKIDVVPYILKESFHNHIRLNQTSFSILVMAYMKHAMVDDCLTLLREKKWRDSAFESHLYHLLICSCKESGRLNDAVKIYNQTMESDEINLHITSTMIDIYTVMGEFGEAEKLYLTLKSSGVVLDKICFSIVVRMYVKAGSLEEACSVLEIMDERKDIVPDMYLFRDMLRIYQKCGLQDKLQHLYYKIRKSGIHWDQEMYNCVINCCARALPLDELSRAFEEMIRCGFTPNTVTFNVLLDVYGKAKLFKKVEELFLLARRHGVVDVISYNTIIAAYGHNKDFANMSSAVRNMQFDGFCVSLEAYNSMLDAYGKDKQLEKFRSILKIMKKCNLESDQYTYNIMINIYGEQGWIDEVTDVLRELKESGLGPDLCSYNTLIKAYGIGGMVEEAVGLVKEMRVKGITPNKVTYTNLVTALRRNDEFLEAIKWSLWVKQMGI